MCCMCCSALASCMRPASPARSPTRGAPQASVNTGKLLRAVASIPRANRAAARHLLEFLHRVSSMDRNPQVCSNSSSSSSSSGECGGCCRVLTRTCGEAGTGQLVGKNVPAFRVNATNTTSNSKREYPSTVTKCGTICNGLLVVPPFVCVSSACTRRHTHLPTAGANTDRKGGHYVCRGKRPSLLLPKTLLVLLGLTLSCLPCCSHRRAWPKGSRPLPMLQHLRRASHHRRR